MSAAGRAAAEALFAGEGEVRALARTLDWGRTPLGWPDRWSPALRIATRAMLDSSFPICLWSGPDYALVYNDAYRRILAAKHPAALGQGGAVVWAEIWPQLESQFAQVRAGGPPVYFENARFVMARLEGGGTEDAWFSYSLSALRDEDGGVAAVLNISPETTGRVMAERGLQVERARLEEVFHRAPSFIVAFRGPEQVYEFVNEAYYQLVGHRPILGKPLLDALPELRGQGFDAMLENVRQTGEPWVGRETPVTLERTPGAPPEVRYLDMVFQPLTDADGTRSGVVAHGSDITEQVLARREVERARERADRLQSLTAALAATMTPEEAAEVAVAQGLAATGASGGALSLRALSPSQGRDELVIMRQMGLTPILSATFARMSIDAQVPSAASVRTGEAFFLERREVLRATFPEAAHVWDELGTQALATVPLTVGGESIGAISFTFSSPRAFPVEDREFFLALGRQAAQALERARLLAAEREARAQAEQARRDAEAANRAKSEFLAIMSHELRTPLNAIGGYAELMQIGVRGPVTAEQRADLERLQRAQRHLLGLINGVLNFAKVDAGAIHYDIRDIAVGAVLASCEMLIAPQARAKGISVRYEAGDERLWVRADDEKMQQVVLNLLSNAVKFTDPGGQITLSCGVTERGAVAVRVRDTGRGIPADQIERVFHPFVQVDARLTRTQEGTGLGLAISRDLARGMGGELTAESTVGAGSTFTLTLPAA